MNPRSLKLDVSDAIEGFLQSKLPKDEAPEQLRDTSMTSLCGCRPASDDRC